MSSRVMLLVDFDNVSTEVIEQAFELLRQDYGAIHVRRAYCTAEQAQQHAGFMKRLGLRPMVNLAVGKNSTDIALAVDAMDLVLAERPTVVVIVSSDSDYTPLVGRLREKGAWVRGFGQQGKTGEGVPGAYDQFSDIAHRSGVAAAKRGRTQAPTPAPAAKPVPALASAPAPAAAKRKPAARKKSVAAPAPAEAAAPALPPEIEAILQAVPALRGGERVELGEAAQALRQAGLLARTAPSTKLFKKHGAHFLLSPERQPNKVQFSAA
ncbi:NYN domain-containing protein [Roseateles violae]|uniref:NYN domain-containing protein n=1 Tax=Roseateles violae TaxID=3058042 RepID=A0ABT8DVJ2_9BURK|nr:NYN domain-containing protein [Pelomonas sp. PFR6]MDN3922287.1 NYN domain-containing protein [Pelomonas sp. PFR6]